MNTPEQYPITNLEGLKIPAGEFSWSPSRHAVFSQCRRAYFLRFYLSVSGWDLFPPHITREAYFCKHVYTFDNWLTFTICESVRDTIAKITGGDPKRKHRGLDFYLPRQFAKATMDLQESLEHMEYLVDAKRPTILEHLKGQKGFASVQETSQLAFETLSAICSSLLKSGTLEEVSNMNMLDLRTDEIFFRVNYHLFSLWTVPGLVYFKDGMLCSLNCRTHYSSAVSAADFLGRISRINSVFRLFGQQKYPEYPILCTTLTFEPELNSVSINCFDDNIREIIDQSSKEMLSLIHEDNTVCLRDFPETCNKGACDNCPFVPVCKMISQLTEGK